VENPLCSALLKRATLRRRCASVAENAIDLEPFRFRVYLKRHFQYFGDLSEPLDAFEGFSL
jgi:hypothetical protein